MTTEIPLPPELEDAVRTGAANAPARPFDRAEVYTRARRIRRRARAVRAVAAGVVLALGASYPFVHARLVPEVADGGLVGGQPIGLWADRPQPPKITDYGSAAEVPGAKGDVAGQLRTVGGRNVVVPAGDPPRGFGLPLGASMGPAPIQGGGLAAVGSAPASDVSGLYDRAVVVLDPTGRAVASHRVAAKVWESTGEFAQRLMPMTGNATTLFWWAFQDMKAPHVVLNRYDIRSGRWTVLRPAVGQKGFALPYYGMQATASRILSWPAVGGPTCSADIEDAGTGERVGVLRPVVSNCTDAYFALSPDNRKAAVLVTYRTVKDWSQRVLIMDVSTGKTLREVALPTLPAGTDRSELATGIDWLGNEWVRYARASFVPSDPAHDPVMLRIRP
ncbi:hypothetical protein [Actinoplanes sp. NPDC051411]|uniref:hypothetical protein n=1 Tax=Actinoplanes sp. NPDC051411 TaxID=3155522 RepID=UPI003429A23B